MQYFAKDTDHVVLTQVVQTQNVETGEWYAAYVDAASGEVVNVISFVADASVSAYLYALTCIYSQIPL